MKNLITCLVVCVLSGVVAADTQFLSSGEAIPERAGSLLIGITPSSPPPGYSREKTQAGNADSRNIITTSNTVRFTVDEVDMGQDAGTGIYGTPTDEWSAFGITMSNVYLYYDDRDNWWGDHNGVSTKTADGGTVSFINGANNLAVYWIAVYPADYHIRAYSADGTLLESFEYLNDGDDLVGSTEFNANGISYIEFNNAGGYITVSHLEWNNSSGQIWTVDDDAGADFYYIQDAINAASDGDEILVYPGTYTDTSSAVVNMMGKAVWLHSSDGPETTIIDGEDVRRGIVCVSGETSMSIIEGLKITRGYTAGNYPDNCGGGMFCDNSSSPTLENCIFESNSAPFGGGMFNNTEGDTPTITNCTFSANTVTNAGGGMYNYEGASPTMTNCVFDSNSASLGGGVFQGDFDEPISSSSPTFTNCTFTNNNADLGGGMRNWNSSPVITSCTFENNISSSAGGGISSYTDFSSSPVIENSYFCGNQPDHIEGFWDDYGGNTFADNCSGDPTGACCVDTSCSTGTAADCTAAGGTYLGDGSSCSGDPCGDPTGACCVDTSCSIETATDCSAAGGTYQGDGSSCSGDPCSSGCPADINGDGYVDVSDLLAVIDQWGLTNSPADVNQDGIVDVSDLLMVVGNWGPCSGGSNVWTVDDDAGADFYYIQDAIDAALDGDEILVYPGTYTDTGDNVVDMMGKAVWLHSSDGPNTTIIDGEDVRRGILSDSGETSKTIIEGFTITNGYASGNGGGIYTDASPTITNCIISGNTATGHGGGADLRGSNCAAVITDCTISNNVAEQDVGGLCCVYSYPTIANCLIAENSAERVGGLLVDNTATITNCIIWDNSEAQTYTGGVYFYGASCTMTETTVCGNTQPQTYGDYTDGGGNTVADTCPKR